MAIKNSGKNPGSKSGFRIEVFRTGTFKPMSGDEISYGADDLAGIASGYDPDNSPAPIVIGHPSTDAPAYGWVSGFEYDADTDRLYADIDELDPAFTEAVKAGRYKKVSMSFHTPDAPNNPTPGKWYAKHIGFLGGAAPAVSGLKPVQLAESAEGEAVTFEASFGEAGFEETADLFRAMRDWFIEKFGLEAADKVLPSYRIDWLSDRELSGEEPTPLFSEAARSPRPASPQEEEPTMTPEEIQAEKERLAAREAELNARDDDLKSKEAAQRSAEHAAFAETLITEGKLLPANKDKFVAILNAMPEGSQVSFSEGSEEPVTKALMALMSEQPGVVSFGQTDLGEDPGDIAENALQLANFASAYQKSQADAGNYISISDAVEHVKKKGASK